MKYFLFILILLAITGIAQAARFDSVLGEPTVIEDGTLSDTLQQSRFDASLGVPTILFDATAVQTAVTVVSVRQSIIWFEEEE